MSRRAVIVLLLLGGTLAGGGILAILHLQDTARRLQCINHLKQLSLAVHNYHDTYRRLPSAIVRTPGHDFPPEKHLSWIYSIDPYVEARMDKRWMAAATLPWDAPENRRVIESYTLPVLTCPAAPPGELTVTHYVGITGLGPDAAELPAGDPRAGAFGYRRIVTLPVADGNAQTLMLAETVTDNGPWYVGGFTTARGLDPQGPNYLGPQGQFSSFHGSGLSAHEYVTNVAFLDGSVRSLTADLSPLVFQAMATCAGAEAISFETP